MRIGCDSPHVLQGTRQVVSLAEFLRGRWGGFFSPLTEANPAPEPSDGEPVNQREGLAPKGQRETS
jgi:hypothetical protein